MENDIILQIGNRIREKRKEGNVTLQELADSAGVSKGLISQIENNRTVPSLPVLLNIIKALQVDLNAFFDNLDAGKDNEPVLIKAGEGKAIKKEYSNGSHYHRIISFRHNGRLVDVVLYRQEKGARRGMVSTNAIEYNYMLRGKMQYEIEGKTYILEEGDSFHYDARKPHLTRCLEGKDCLMLVIYFFEEEA
ncbi:transcriptional regulator, XRE family with cupin sensor [Filimonas lacunae]|uniref:Transcriptional regulator, XRE family with cupin sensor n=1 Tax=Filimonas lacunae TaxID=477680 RepID=A0A173MMB3_9BACT|nr:XRE family transcriptional regulator [Filimonas lacunae]BAV08617.1 transcriptional regulator, MerR family [Filimonas lacunae]SIS58564.1 transcriptional regulator, XRE family with cupin sensor [Filimonas lacunae]